MTATRDAFNSAVSLHQRGQLAEAARLYQQILREQPGHSNALHLLGVIAHQSGQNKTAVDLIRRAITIAPENAAFHGNLGTALSAQGRHDEALDAYRRAVQLDPAYVDGQFNLATTLNNTGQRDEAIEIYRRVLELAPDHAGALNNLGTALRSRGDVDAALSTLERAVAAGVTSPESLYNLANTLRDVGRLDESVTRLEQARTLQPEEARIHAALGITHLTQGRLAEGWPEYEWRLQCDGGRISGDCQPLWDGSPLEGRRILLFSEQGAGDTLQFIRYARRLHDDGATVLVEGPGRFRSLLSRTRGVDHFVARGEPLPPFDVAAPMMSLPGLTGTTLENIPDDAPYLEVDESLVGLWRQRLEAVSGFRIGIAWQGAPDFPDDHIRSIPLHHFEALTSVPGIRLIKLQKGFGTEQADALADRIPLHDVGAFDEEHAFADSAAIMRNLDLVISSDTSIVHLAGGLGVPVWIALTRIPDWRWMLDRDDSPWYPTARLFRQHERGDWSDVFRRMAAALREEVCRVRPEPQPATQTTMQEPLRVEIAAGELFDKITILQIKRENIEDPTRVQNVIRELESLTETAGRFPESDQLTALISELRETNGALWNIEDEIRICERDQDFGERFVELARSVYRTNDERSAIKRRINDLLGSRIVEEKSYSEY